MMRKASRGAPMLVEQEDMPYRTFTRPMVMHNKNGGVKVSPAGGKCGKANTSKAAKPRPTPRAVHQLKQSERDDEDEDEDGE